jgi:long-subunit fatty acid transport protein
MAGKRLTSGRYWSVALLVLCLISVRGFAQFPEDALRFATPGFGVGARALGMGNAYTGVANDFSALYWNPAGLAQMHLGELSIGISHLNYGNTGTFFNEQQSYTNNSTQLNAFGLVLPVPVRKGSLVFAFGYDRNSDFTTGLSFSGFNPNSSIIQTYARAGASVPNDVSGNIAYQLFLANIDTLTNKFQSPINGRVTQLAKVIEGGGLNNWSAGGAVEFAKDLSVGLTLTYMSGTYKYERNYKEQDNRNIYTTFPFDFDQLTLDENVESDITGVNGKLGLMYTVPERFRLGFGIKTPTSFQVKENFSTVAQSFFKNGDVKPDGGPLQILGSDQYDVLTPWVFSVGASVILRDLVLSGDIDYTDWTQLEFKNANPEVLAYNNDFKDIFQATANVRLGAEYDIKDYGVRVRGGFMYNPSPYQGDPSSFAQKYATGGLGFLLGESSMLDLAYAHGWWKSFRTNYDATSRVDEDISTNNVIMTFSYRF